MKQDLIRTWGKWLGLLGVALAALPAAAQFGQPPAPRHAPVCDAALCSASGLSLPALSEVARADTPPATAVPSGVRDPWNRHMPVRPDLESYDCILSLGVGGELSKGGFLGTRVLGQTQVWRKPADELKQ